jgi:hypothetical protein
MENGSGSEETGRASGAVRVADGGSGGLGGGCFEGFNFSLLLDISSSFSHPTHTPPGHLGLAGQERGLAGCHVITHNNASTLSKSKHRTPADHHIAHPFATKITEGPGTSSMCS